MNKKYSVPLRETKSPTKLPDRQEANKSQELIQHLHLQLWALGWFALFFEAQHCRSLQPEVKGPLFYSRSQPEQGHENNSIADRMIEEDVSEETSPDPVPNFASSASTPLGASGDRFVSSGSQLLF